MGSGLYRDRSRSNAFPSAMAADSVLQNQSVQIREEYYTLINRLGGGAFGSVWSALTPDGRSAAIKTIDVSGRTGGGVFDAHTLVQSFQKEVKMAYKMRQETQHVVTIYDFDFDPRTGLALMAMELGGESLSERLVKLHRTRDMERNFYGIDGSTAMSSDYISSGERKNIWTQLVDIVLTLHRHRVVHRDMKPDNLVFFGPIMKIVDLGIAEKDIAGYGPNADGIGTEYYSAPECFQMGAHVTSKADLWSAGAILYHMTYGVPPLENSPVPPSDTYPTSSAHVEDVLIHCLQQNPHKRGSHHWLARHAYTTNPLVL